MLVAGCVGRCVFSENGMNNLPCMLWRGRLSDPSQCVYLNAYAAMHTVNCACVSVHQVFQQKLLCICLTMCLTIWNENCWTPSPWDTFPSKTDVAGERTKPPRINPLLCGGLTFIINYHSLNRTTQDSCVGWEVAASIWHRWNSIPPCSCVLWWHVASTYSYRKVSWDNADSLHLNFISVFKGTRWPARCSGAYDHMCQLVFQLCTSGVKGLHCPKSSIYIWCFVCTST